MIKATEYCEKVFDGTHDSPKPTDKGHLLITSKNIMRGYIDFSGSYPISDIDYETIQKRSQVKKWDILFSMIGTVGNVCLIQDDNVNYAIKNMGVFSVGDEYKAKWLYFYLQSPYIKKINGNYLNGAIQKFLPLGYLRNIEIPEFDNKKKKIVDFLWNLENTIINNDKVNSELESLAKTIYDYWFLQFEFPNEEGKPYKSSGGKMVWNDELKKEIPEGWEVRQIGRILDKVPKTQSVLSDDYSKGNKYPIIDQSRKFICGYTDDEEKVLHLKDAIVFGDHTNFSKYVNFDFARGADGTQIIISNCKELPNYLLYLQIISLPVIEQGYSRHFKFLKEQNVIIPTSNISRKFIYLIEKPLEMVRKNVMENQELASLRDFLLPMLMNGQVTFKDENY